MIRVENLVVNYGAIKALKGISINVPSKSIVTLIGANGAGKTTILRTISSVVKSESGRIIYENKDITNEPPHKIVNLGISQVPEGRLIFSNLTVKENLDMGSYSRKDKNNFRDGKGYRS